MLNFNKPSIVSYDIEKHFLYVAEKGNRKRYIKEIIKNVSCYCIDNVFCIVSSAKMFLFCYSEIQNVFEKHSMHLISFIKICR